MNANHSNTSFNCNCIGCYYFDICPKFAACDDYTPLSDDVDDSTIEELTQRGREEYASAWNEYIKEWQ